MLEHEGRQPGDVLGPGLVALSDELVQRRVHVDRVPKQDQIDHESERAELVLLTFAVALAQLAAPAVKDHPGELVTSLAAVKLSEDAPTVALVIDEAQE